MKDMETNKDKNICPVCDEENKCGANKKGEDCWCFSVDFSDDLKKSLEKDFLNQPCVCKNCFEKMNEENSD